MRNWWTAYGPSPCLAAAKSRCKAQRAKDVAWGGKVKKQLQVISEVTGEVAKVEQEVESAEEGTFADLVRFCRRNGCIFDLWDRFPWHQVTGRWCQSGLWDIYDISASFQLFKNWHEEKSNPAGTTSIYTFSAEVIWQLPAVGSMQIAHPLPWLELLLVWERHFLPLLQFEQSMQQLPTSDHLSKALEWPMESEFLRDDIVAPECPKQFRSIITKRGSGWPH